MKNRGFEDANLPPACRLQGSFVVPPRTPHFWKLEASDWQMPWNVESKWPGWTMEASGGSDADFQLVEDHPLSAATPHSLQVTVRAVTPTGRIAVINSGYWGMAIQRGESYKLDGKELACSEVKTYGIGWQKYETTQHATATDPKARAVFSLEGARLARFYFLISSEDFSQPPQWPPAGFDADDRRSQARFHKVSRWMFCRRDHDRRSPAVKRSIGALESRPGTYSP